ncbi:Nuclear cap-binding protein subunit 3 [Plecturocebus cupreus]
MRASTVSSSNIEKRTGKKQPPEKFAHVRQVLDEKRQHSRPQPAVSDTSQIQAGGEEKGRILQKSLSAVTQRFAGSPLLMFTAGSALPGKTVKASTPIPGRRNRAIDGLAFNLHPRPKERIRRKGIAGHLAPRKTTPNRRGPSRESSCGSEAESGCPRGRRQLPSGPTLVQAGVGRSSSLPAGPGALSLLLTVTLSSCRFGKAS